MKHDKLIKFIEENVQVGSYETRLIEKYFTPFTASKKFFLEKESRIAKHLYFINSGFVRVFHTDNGVETTTHIGCHPGFITSFSSFISVIPASDNVGCLTQCELLKITKNDLDTFYQHSQKWTAFCKNVYEKSLAYHGTANERYTDTFSREKIFEINVCSARNYPECAASIYCFIHWNKTRIIKPYPQTGNFLTFVKYSRDSFLELCTVQILKLRTVNSIIQIPIFPFGMINYFLIRGTSKHILVDTGVPGSKTRILKQIKSHGINEEDIGLIIVTHGHIDHFGSAAELKQELDVPVLMHDLDTIALRTGRGMTDTLKPNKRYWNILKRKVLKDKATPCEPDIILKGDCNYDLSEWGVNGKIIHTPGHTPGSIFVILDDGNALIMDLASSGIFLGGIMFYSRMKHPPFHDDLSMVKQSIEKVLMENADTFYLGHGGPVSRERLVYYLENFL